MSYEATRAAWEFIASPEGARLLPLDRLVLLNLADRLNGKTRKLNPSMVTIAKDCGCSDRAARMAVGRLTMAGVLVRRRGGGARSNAYTLFLTPEDSSAPTPEHISVPPEDSSVHPGKKRQYPRNDLPTNQEEPEKEPVAGNDAAAEGSVVAFRNYRRPTGPARPEGIDMVRADEAMKAVMENLPWNRSAQ